MKPRAQTALILTVITGASLLCVFPVCWMLLTALRPHSEIFSRSLHLMPSRLAWQNFGITFGKYPVALWAWNSFAITILGTALTILLDLFAGYAFAKFQFRGRDALFLIFLATLTLPTQVLMVPQFMTVAALHGVNTYWAAILPRAAETYGVFLARQFLTSLPDDLLDAARLDGAGEWRIFWHIVVPLSKPTIAVLALLLFLGEWNDFGWPLVILRDQSAMTLPVGLSMLQGYRVNDWSGMMVIALVSIVPVLALFLALQSYFVQGLSRAGLK